MIRTSLGPDTLDAGGVVSSYKALAQVERVFRGFNTDLDIRPIRHRTAERVRAHVFLRMLSYYVSWHMAERLAPILFKDDDRASARAARTAPVAPERRPRRRSCPSRSAPKTPALPPSTATTASSPGPGGERPHGMARTGRRGAIGAACTVLNPPTVRSEAGPLAD